MTLLIIQLFRVRISARSLIVLLRASTPYMESDIYRIEDLVETAEDWRQFRNTRPRLAHYAITR